MPNSLQSANQATMAEPAHFKVEPLTYADFPASHRISKLTFIDDRQTQLKRLGDVHYLRDDPVSAHRSFVRGLQRPGHVCAKAGAADGFFLGSLGIQFLNFDPADVPHWDRALLGAAP